MQDSGHKPPPSFYPDLEVERKTVTPIDEQPIKQVEDPITQEKTKTFEPPPSFYPDMEVPTPKTVADPTLPKQFQLNYKWAGHPSESKINDEMEKLVEKGIVMHKPDGKGGLKYGWEEKNSDVIRGLMSVYGINPQQAEITEREPIPYQPNPQEQARIEKVKAQSNEEGLNLYRQSIKDEKALEEEKRSAEIEKGMKKSPVFATLIQGTEGLQRGLMQVGSTIAQTIFNGKVDPIQTKVDVDAGLMKIGDLLGVDKSFIQALNDAKPRYDNNSKTVPGYVSSFDYETWWKNLSSGMNDGFDKISKALDMKYPYGGKKTNSDDKLYDLADGVMGIGLTGLTAVFGLLPKELEEFTMLRVTLATAVTKGVMEKIPDNVYGDSETNKNHVRRIKGIVETVVPLFLVGKKAHDLTGKLKDKIDGKIDKPVYSVDNNGKVVYRDIPDVSVKEWPEFQKKIAEERQVRQAEVDALRQKQNKTEADVKMINELSDGIDKLDNLKESDWNVIQQVVEKVQTEMAKNKTTEKRLKEMKGRTEDPAAFPEFKTEEQKKNDIGTLIDTPEGLTQLGDIKDREKLALIKELEDRTEAIDKVLTPGVSDELRRDALSKKSELNSQIEVLKKEIQPVEDKNIVKKREEELIVEINKEKKQGGKLIQRVEADTPEAKQLNYKIDTHNKIVEESKTKEANNPPIPEEQFVKEWKNKSHEEQSKILDRWDIEPTINEKGVDKKGLPYERITLKNPKQIYEEYTGKIKEFKDSKVKVDDLNRWKFVEDYSKLSKEEKALYLKNNGLDNKKYRNPHEVFNEIAKRREETAIAKETEKVTPEEKPIATEIEKPIEEKPVTETVKPEPIEKPLENPDSVAKMPVEVSQGGDKKPTGDNKAYSILKALTEPENPLKWEELKTALKPEPLEKMTNAEAKDLQKNLAQMRKDGLIYPAGDVGYLETGKIEATPKGKEFIKEFQKKMEQKDIPEEVSKPIPEANSKAEKKKIKEEQKREPAPESLEDNRSFEEIHNTETLLKEDIDRLDKLVEERGLTPTIGTITNGNIALISDGKIKISPDATYSQRIMATIHELTHNKLTEREEKRPVNKETQKKDPEPLYVEFKETIDNYIELAYPEEKLWASKERIAVLLTDLITLPDNGVITRKGTTVLGRKLEFNDFLKKANAELGPFPTNLNIVDPKSRLEVLNATKEFKGSLIDQALHALGTYMGNKFKLINSGALDRIFQKSYDTVVDVFGGSGILSQILMDKVIKGTMEVKKFVINDKSNLIYNFHKTMLNPEAADLIKVHMGEVLNPLFDPIVKLMKAEQEGKNLKKEKEFYQLHHGEMLSYWKKNIIEPLEQFDLTGKSNLTPEQLVALQEIQVRFGVRGQFSQGLAREWSDKGKFQSEGPFYRKNKNELNFHMYEGDAKNNPFVNNKYSANKRLNEMYTHPKINLEITNKNIYENGKWGLPEDIHNGKNLIQADFPYLDTKEYKNTDKGNLSAPDNPYAMEVRQKFFDDFKDQHVVFYDSNHPKIEEFVHKNSDVYSHNKLTEVGFRKEYMATNGKRLFNGEAEAITNPASKVIENMVKIDKKADPKLLDASSMLNPMFWVEQGKLTVKGYEIVKEALTSPEFKAKMVDAYIKLRDTGKDLAKNLGTAFAQIPYKILEKLPEWQKFVTDVIKTGAETVKGIFNGEISLTGGNSLPMFIGGEGARRLKKAGREVSEKIKGLDGKDRYWIEDGAMEISTKLIDAERNIINGKREQTTWKMEEVIRHPELLDAYPFMKDWEIKKDFEMLTDHTKGDGIYTSDLGYIKKNGTATLIGYNGRKVGINIEKGWSREQVGEKIKETIVHEIQHGIQETEGFAPGGNSIDVISHLDSKQLQTELVRELPQQKRISDIWYPESVKELDALNYTEKKIREANIEDVMRMNEIYTKSELWTAEESKEITKLQEKIFGVKPETGIKGAFSKPPYRLDYVAMLLKGKGEEVKTKAQNNFDAESNRRDIIQHVEYYRDNNLPMKEKASREYLNYLDYKSEGSISQGIYHNLAGEIEARISGKLSTMNGVTIEKAKQWLDGYRDKAVVLKPNDGMYNMNIDIAREHGILVKGELRPEVRKAAEEVASKSKLFREFSNKLVGDLGEKIVPFVRMLWREFTENKHPEAVQQGGLGFWRKNVPEIDPKVNKAKKLTNLDPIDGVGKRDKNRFMKSHGQGIFAAVEKHLGTMNNEAVTEPAIKVINEYKSPQHMLESFANRPINWPTNNVEIEALKIMRGNTFVTLLDAFNAKDVSKAMQDVYAKSLMDFLSWTEILRGHTTTVARALQQAGADTKIMEFMSNPLNHGKKVDAVLERLTLQNFSGNFDSVLKATSKLQDAFTKPSLKDKGLYIFYNGLLGSLGVDVTNITGNATHLGWEFLINHSYNPYAWKDLGLGAWKGGKMAWDIVKGSRDELSKFDVQDLRAMQREPWRYGIDYQNKNKLTETLIRLPGQTVRALMVPTVRLEYQDAFFRSIGRQLMRGKVERGFTRTEFKWQPELSTSKAEQLKSFKTDMEASIDRILADSDLLDINSPKYKKLMEKSPELEKVLKGVASIDRYARHLVFQQELGPKGKGFQKALRETVLGTAVIPFFRIGVNTTKVSFQNSPLGLAKLTKSQIEAWSTNGKEIKNISDWHRQNVYDFSQLTATEKAQQLRRGIAGTSLMVGLGYAMVNGLITITGSGPKNSADREAWEAAGFRPYHIYLGSDINDKTGTSYQNLEHFGMPLAVLGGIGDYLASTPKEQIPDSYYELAGTFLSLATYNSGKYLTDQSYMQGLKDMLGSITDKERFDKYMLRWAVRTGTSSIPFVRAIEGTRKLITGDRTMYEKNPPSIKDESYMGEMERIGEHEFVKNLGILREIFYPNYKLEKQFTALGDEKQSSYQKHILPFSGDIQNEAGTWLFKNKLRVNVPEWDAVDGKELREYQLKSAKATKNFIMKYKAQLDKDPDSRKKILGDIQEMIHDLIKSNPKVKDYEIEKTIDKTMKLLPQRVKTNNIFKKYDVKSEKTGKPYFYTLSDKEKKDGKIDKERLDRVTDDLIKRTSESNLSSEEKRKRYKDINNAVRDAKKLL